VDAQAKAEAVRRMEAGYHGIGGAPPSDSRTENGDRKMTKKKRRSPHKATGQFKRRKNK
jgi:hypothetical protein